jgi:hypothetical protein
MSVTHCLATIDRIVLEENPSRRSILQLGYNLGRLSELTGLGREPFWDGWKEPVASWDVEALLNLAQKLHLIVSQP